MSAPEPRPAPDETESIWIKCTACQEILFRKEVERRLFVCSKCGAHLRLTVEQRLLTLVDRGSFTEHDADLRSTDPLQFSDRRPYEKRLTDAWKKTGRYDAVLCGVGFIAGRAVALGIFDFSFLGGSMGTVVGEKLTRIVEHAIRERIAGRLLCGVRRSPDAGRGAVADANGEGEYGLGLFARAGAAVSFRDDRPDHWRSGRLTGVGRRPQHC